MGLDLQLFGNGLDLHWQAWHRDLGSKFIGDAFAESKGVG